MKNTINTIKSFDPCSEGFVRLIKQLGGDFNRDQEFEISSLVNGKNTIGDITWLLGELGEKAMLVEFSIFCAELVLPISEKDNDSKAPREAINAAKAWLENPTEENRLKCRAYACDVVVVAYAADGAYAADAADAAGCARASTSSLSAAARYAADARDVQDKINNKLIELLNSKY